MGIETFPPGFFDRAEPARLAEAGLDAAAVESLRDFYDDLGIDGRVLGLCAGSPDHFHLPPDEMVRHRLDTGEELPFEDASFDDALCCQGIASLTHPIDSFAEVARVLRPGGRFICTFSGHPYAPATIKGWLANDDAGRVRIARRYFELTPGFGPPESDLRTSLTGAGDRLWAVWASRRDHG